VISKDYEKYFYPILPYKVMFKYLDTGDKSTSLMNNRRDQQGGSPRVRPFHCTEVGLTPAIIPNADNSVILVFAPDKNESRENQI
jgi:hypothetical protein